MWAYELLAGIKKEERHRSLNLAETRKLEPLLKKEDLLGSILYYEYRTDDARLTLDIIKEAVHRGVLAVSYMKVTGFIYDDGKVKGVTVEDQLNENRFNVKSDYVINASGPWVDDLDKLDKPTQGNKLQHTKGVHLVFNYEKLPLKQSVYFDTFDKRMIFAIPHRGKTYVGTTDTFFNGNQQNPEATKEDKEYLLKCVNDYLGHVALRQEDIESCWAGVRPLIKKAGKKPSEISRRDETFVWDSGLISIAGGKLTGYRKMAQRVVDMVADKINSSGLKTIPGCSTDRIYLSQHRTEGKEPAESAQQINTISRLPQLLHAELDYAIEHEMCLTPSDFFIRRTGMMYFDIDGVIKYQSAVFWYMKNLLNWNESQSEAREKEFQQALSSSSKIA